MEEERKKEEEEIRMMKGRENLGEGKRKVFILYFTVVTIERLHRWTFLELKPC